MNAVRELVTLVRAGIVRPMRPDRLLGVVGGYLRWDLTLPFGYAVGAARHPDRIAIIDELGSLSYREVEERTTRLAHGLTGRGVRAGSTVGLLCRNHRGFIEAAMACAKLGANTVLLNTGLATAQLRAVLSDQQVTTLIADEEFAGDFPGVTTVVAWTDGPPDQGTLQGLIDSSAATPLPRRPPRGRLIVLTSGTTGTPKGARRPEPASLSPAAALLSRIPLHSGEVSLISAPLFHTWGLAAFQIGVVLGATLVLHRRFDPKSTVDALASNKCTSLFAVPVMLQRILDLHGAPRPLPALRVVASSGSALPAPVAQQFQREFGPVLYNLYGSTEVSWATIATPEDLHAAPSTAGRPPLGTRLAILDEAGAPVPQGGVGRIFVGNDMLFEGYTNGSGKEVREGLMSTGDLGHLDAEGRLFVVGRDDEMIVSGGENVYPRATEDAIAALPQVREVAVVGVPDAEFGQRLAAFVVLTEGAELTAESVRDHVRGRLARYCVPREVTFLDELPRNSTGKVLKRLLR
ncbi:AMP-binding protein [Kutzneria viridogrisea]|uniref:Fatty-acyl-CoA synthase n=1 Tax=Kutzneria viridogrisea TaxID=47990 RepID=A0ABR6BU72_9PSEU|nr:fatty-acyl-CoA synthase [Kutzneria viridogrisea]